MIFTGFKRKSNQFFFDNRLPNWLKKPADSSSKEITNVLVLIDNISEKEMIHKSLLSLFEIESANLDIIVVQQKISKDQVSEEINTPKDFGWFGKIKSDRLKSVLTKKYDLLINYSNVDNLYCNLLLLQCKVAFKTGFAHLDSRFYDLTIDCEPNNLELFNNELKKYLIILNKI